MYCFDYRDAAPLGVIPELGPDAFRAAVLEAVADGARLLALFGMPPDDAPDRVSPGRAALMAVVARDGATDGENAPARTVLGAVRTAPLAAFPSLASACPQAQRFEREIYERWGVVPEGHPWLKPVRRSPDAPPDTDGTDLPCEFYRVDGDETHEVAVGPIHAGIIEPGHFRFQCYGETVLHLEIALGYQHRGLERLALDAANALAGGRTRAMRALRLVECAAGDSSVAHATAHCVLRERLLGLGPLPQRVQRLRRLGLELERLANHCGDLGAIAGDTGFLPTSAWNGRIRGDFLNLTASLCGNRFGRELLAPGGVARELEPDDCADILARLTAAGRDSAGSVAIMAGSASVQARLAGTGRLSREQAELLGLVGVAARASGLMRDARFCAPLSALPVYDTRPRTARDGDVAARAEVRRAEMADSLALATADLQWLAAHPASGEDTALAAQLREAARAALPPQRLAVAQVEGWRGEICHLGVTGADGLLLAAPIVDPSFRNWDGLALAMRGGQISDFPLCNKSFNLSYCGHDL